MIISMIAAVGRNGEIGKNGGLLWRLPGDLPFFKKTTMGKCVIMGRKTFESLPGALPGRKNIVISSRAGYLPEKAVSVLSPAEALREAEGDEVFIIGGGKVYEEFIGMADRLYLTEAQAEDGSADTFFPQFDKSVWTREVLDENTDGIPYVHALYTRISTEKTVRKCI